jgi:hypothetical protein
MFIMTNTTLDTIDAVIEELQVASAISDTQLKNWAVNQSLDEINSKTLYVMSSVLIENITAAGGTIDPSIERLRDQLQAALDRTETGIENNTPNFSTSFGMVLNVLTEKAGIDFSQLASEMNDAQSLMMRRDATKVIDDIISQKILEMSELPASPIEEFDSSLTTPTPVTLEDRIFEIQTAELNNAKNTLAVQIENLLTGEKNAAVQDADQTVLALADIIKRNNPETSITEADIQSIFTPITAESMAEFEKEYKDQLESATLSSEIANAAPLEAVVKTDILNALQSLKMDDTRQVANLYEPLGIRSEEYDANAARINNQMIDTVINTLDRYDTAAEKLTQSIKQYADPQAKKTSPASEITEVGAFDQGVDSPENGKASSNGRY